MKRIIPMLVILLAFLLVPCGDLVSREKPPDPPPDSREGFDDPEGEDHPWGGDQSGTFDDLKRFEWTPVATSISTVDLFYNLPFLRTFFVSRLERVSVDRRGQLSDRDQVRTEYTTSTSNSRYGVVE